MTRSTRKRTETVTVEELLRRTGATPRRIGPAVPVTRSPGARPRLSRSNRTSGAQRVRAAAGGWSKPVRAWVRAWVRLARSPVTRQDRCPAQATANVVPMPMPVIHSGTGS